MVTFHWMRHLWLQVPSGLVLEEGNGIPRMTSPHEEGQEEMEEQGAVNERERLYRVSSLPGSFLSVAYSVHTPSTHSLRSYCVLGSF